MKKNVLRIFVTTVVIIFSIYIYSNFNNRDNINKTKIKTSDESSTQVNIIKDVNYSANDARGNEYLIYAEEGPRVELYMQRVEPRFSGSNIGLNRQA